MKWNNKSIILVEELLECLALVNLGTDRAGGQVQDPLERWPVTQEVEWVAKQDRFSVGDCLHSRDIADNLSLFLQKENKVSL